MAVFTTTLNGDVEQRLRRRLYQTALHVTAVTISGQAHEALTDVAARARRSGVGTDEGKGRTVMIKARYGARCSPQRAGAKQRQHQYRQKTTKRFGPVRS